MNAISVSKKPSEITHIGPPRMGGAFVGSLVFHATIVGLLIFGLPFVKQDLPPLADSITVEIADIAELTQTNKPPAESKPKKQARQTSEKPPELAALKPKPVASKEPDKAVAPEKPAPEDVVLPSEDNKPEPLKKVEPPKAKPKPPEKKAAPKPEENVQEFQSLLKNLTPDEVEPEKRVDAEQQGDKPSPLASFADRMTVTELQALQAQLSQCWSVLAGARYAEDLVVRIRLAMNPDKTIRDAKIVDEIQYYRDSFFRAAADGALRAVLNPRCNPLELPDGKYDQWKTIVVTFDPRELL